MYKDMHVHTCNVMHVRTPLTSFGCDSERAQCLGRRFQVTASADRGDFSQISTAIELKLRIKRFCAAEARKKAEMGFR